MKKLFYITLILLTVVSCSNKKQESPDEPVVVVDEKPKEPEYEPSKYASTEDTLLINDLQIVLDSVLVRTPELGEKSGILKIYGADSQEMLNVYVKITNTSKEAKEIPYVDQIEEIRKRMGINSVRIRKSQDQDDMGFRLGSRMFINPEKEEFKVSVKPGQTISGFYTLNYKPHKFSVISFWYSSEDIDSESQTMSMLTKMSKSYKVEGKPIFHILMKDAETKDVGFDITHLMKAKNRD